MDIVQFDMVGVRQDKQEAAIDLETDMVDPGAQVRNLQQHCEEGVHFLKRATVAALLHIGFLDHVVLAVPETAADDAHRAVSRAHGHEVGAGVEGQRDDGRRADVGADGSGPALRLHIVEPNTECIARSPQCELLSTGRPLQAQDRQLDVNVNQHLLPFLIARPPVNKHTTIVAATDYLIILGPVDVGDGLRVIVHLLQQLPGVEVGDVPHSIHAQAQLCLSRQAAEIARLRERQGCQQVLLDES